MNGKVRISLFYIVLLLVGLSGSSVFGGKDVSLSEVPQAVRETIERELKGIEIDDIERDKDDGKIVYEVDTDGGNDLKLKIAEDGTLLEREEELDEDDLPAVILAAVKKSVGDIDIDDVEKRYRRGRKIYYKIEGETDEFKVDLEIAEDGTILDKDLDRKESGWRGCFLQDQKEGHSHRKTELLYRGRHGNNRDQSANCRRRHDYQ